MNDLVFKIALTSLENDPEQKDNENLTLEQKKYLFKELFKKIKEKNIKNKNDFQILLENTMSHNDFMDILHDAFESNKAYGYIKFFGDEGIKYIPDDIIKRNITDLALEKYVPESQWYRFRDKNWINKRTKAISPEEKL